MNLNLTRWECKSRSSTNPEADTDDEATVKQRQQAAAEAARAAAAAAAAAAAIAAKPPASSAAQPKKRPPGVELCIHTIRHLGFGLWVNTPRVDGG